MLTRYSAEVVQQFESISQNLIHPNKPWPSSIQCKFGLNHEMIVAQSGNLAKELVHSRTSEAFTSMAGIILGLPNIWNLWWSTETTGEDTLSPGGTHG